LTLGDGLEDQPHEQLALVAALDAELAAEVTELTELAAADAGQPAAEPLVAQVADLAGAAAERLHAAEALHAQRVVAEAAVVVAERPAEVAAQVLQTAAEEARLPEDG